MQHTIWKPTILGLASAIVMGCPQVRAQPAQGRFVPFNEFIQQTTTVPSRGFVGAPGNRVESDSSLEAMRRHIIDLYRNVPVINSFVHDGQYFDCVPMLRQPSV